MLKAFSLVELSIVLVILGLLTGGILSGQQLIRAAEIRGVASDLQRYTVATRTFQDKYFGLPGDFDNAVRFWGSVTDSGATCPNGQGVGTETCNGAGDGVIGNSGSCPGAYERPRYWQHLANAGLIEGTYTGITPGGANCNTVLIGINAPAARIGNAGYTVIDSRLALGGAVTNAINLAPVLGTDEAWNIDTKLDDGWPKLGAVTTPNVADIPGCIDSNAATAAYQIQTKGKLCSLYMSISRR